MSIERGGNKFDLTPFSESTYLTWCGMKINRVTLEVLEIPLDQILVNPIDRLSSPDSYPFGRLDWVRYRRTGPSSAPVPSGTVYPPAHTRWIFYALPAKILHILRNFTGNAYSFRRSLLIPPAELPSYYITSEISFRFCVAIASEFLNTLLCTRFNVPVPIEWNSDV